MTTMQIKPETARDDFGSEEDCNHESETPKPGQYGYPIEEPPTPHHDELTEGTEARPVTVDTARRRSLWTEGTLLLEGKTGTFEVSRVSARGRIETECGASVAEGPATVLTFIPDCDHDWTTDSRVVEPARSPAHRGGAAPPEYERLPDRCRKCGAKRTT